MAINDSIADARKVEWLGPYTAQQIAVNRYFAELDEVEEKPSSAEESQFLETIDQDLN